MKSEHQKRVEAFMKLAKQDVPDKVTIPSDEVCRLRASLILEEALETISALGCTILAERTFEVSKNNVSVISTHEPDLIELIDGICDLKVVSTGSLSCAGLPDEPFQKIVDENNLEKFADGFSRNDLGKLIKPPNFVGPTQKIKELLDSLEK